MTADLRAIRTDVVGSLLRPQAVKDARARFEEGKIDAAELHRIEDEAVRAAVKLQEDIGLDVVSDGEMRRLNFQDSFGAAVEGYDAAESTMKIYTERVEQASALRRWEIPLHEKGTPISHRRPVKSRLRLARNVPLEEYKFVHSVATKPAKVALIGPDRISQRFAHEQSKHVYKDMDEFMADVVAIEREIIKSLVDAGRRSTRCVRAARTRSRTSCARSRPTRR
jgi:5-methyltetrahydropteroyltriglutamate--homocysteine methyltransferase